MIINTTPVVDMLGSGYTREDIVASDRYNSRMPATLVRHAVPNARSAVLWLHGFSDYFFHTHVAEFFAEQQIELFALDLHRYGRSLRPGLIPNFATAVEDYYGEITQAICRIRGTYGHEHIVGMGHSTGGMIWANYAHDHRGLGRVNGLVLNSPWFEFQGNKTVHAVTTQLVTAMNRIDPLLQLKYPRVGIHGMSMHASWYGEWYYDLTLKPILSEPVRVGWILAMQRGHAKVQQGMNLDVPVLILHSDKSKRFTTYQDEARSVDVVLDVESMRQFGPGLGVDVTLSEIPGATHDVTLSPLPARQQALTKIMAWYSQRPHILGMAQ